MVEEVLSTRGLRMPQNIEAERALLGCLILDNRQVDVVLDIFPQPAVAAVRQAVRGGDGRRRSVEETEPIFFNPTHQTIFESIYVLHDGGGGVDLTTLANHLHSRGQLDAVGGSAYLAGLEDDIFALGQVPEYARIITQKWRLRCLVRAATTMVDEATASGAPVQDIIENAERKIFEISAEQQAKDFQHVEPTVVEQLQEIEARSKGITGLPGLPSGFRDLDHLTAGFRPSQLIIIAARPSVGKTAFVLNIATHAAMRLGRPVGVFSLEMSRAELVQRVLCTEAQVSMSRVRGGAHLTRAELDALHGAGERLANSALFIDDTSNLSILEMRSRARRLKIKCQNLGLVVVDYLQLMQGGSSRIENRQQEVSEISRSLKGLARELEVPILALSQLSRQIEQRRGAKEEAPRLSDLRESGSLEQDADMVIFISRKIMKDKEDEKKKGDPDTATIFLAKHRNGPTGKFPVLFMGEYTQFADIANPERY